MIVKHKLVEMWKVPTCRCVREKLTPACNDYKSRQNGMLPCYRIWSEINTLRCS